MQTQRARIVSAFESRYPEQPDPKINGDSMILKALLRRGALAVSLLSGFASAATVSITPSVSNVNIGDVFDLQVSASGFATPMDAGGLDITWDSAILELGPANYTRAAGFIAPSGNGTPGLGSVTNIFFFADPAKSGNFDIGTIEFRAIASGSTGVVLTESALNPFAGAGGALPVTLVQGSVNVAAGAQTPEPGTFILFGAGAALTLVGTRVSRRMRELSRAALDHRK
jgi:hypothetical protein